MLIRKVNYVAVFGDMTCSESLQISRV